MHKEKIMTDRIVSGDLILTCSVEYRTESLFVSIIERDLGKKIFSIDDFFAKYCDKKGRVKPELFEGKGCDIFRNDINPNYLKKVVPEFDPEKLLLLLIKSGALYSVSHDTYVLK